MTIQEFKEINHEDDPALVSPYLKALWLDRRGRWKSAHDVIENLSTPDASRVHAYLHHKDGDIWNADYWYQKAGRKRPALTPDAEWEDLVASFLKQ